MAVYKEGLKNHATEYQMSQEETKEMIDELTSEGYYEINEYDTGKLYRDREEVSNGGKSDKIQSSTTDTSRIWIVTKKMSNETVLEDILFNSTPEGLERQFKGGLKGKEIIYWSFNEQEATEVAKKEMANKINAASDYIELGPTPYEEDCVPVSKDEDYYPAMKAECEVYKRQLERMFPKGRFSIKSFPHEFGQYCEVIVRYDDTNEEETDMVFEIEDKLPANWDAQAKSELKK